MAGATSRIFNGNKYLLTRQVSTKTEANTIKNTMKKSGWLVRIVKTNLAYKYHIYRRASTAK